MARRQPVDAVAAVAQACARGSIRAALREFDFASEASATIRELLPSCENDLPLADGYVRMLRHHAVGTLKRCPAWGARDLVLRFESIDQSGHGNVIVAATLISANSVSHARFVVVPVGGGWKVARLSLVDTPVK